MDAEDEEVLKWLAGRKEHFEVYRQRTYIIERNGPNGKHEVTLEILDAGPNGDPNLRYMCAGISSNGKTTQGNAAGSLKEALALLHWRELD
jgi:hypothetical protein